VQETSIEDYVEGETAVVSMPVEDADAVVKQEQGGTGKGQILELTTAEPEKRIEKIMIAIRDSLSDSASCNNVDSRADQDDKAAEQRQLREEAELS
jgi:transcriptional regulator CtsR